MQMSMTFGSMTALFGAMIALAIVPDASAIAVSARAMGSGFAHGVITTVGILAGDFIFIILAVFGLSTLAGSMGTLFVLVKYLGVTYLIWLGVGLWISKTKSVEVEVVNELCLRTNFLCGLFITLGDPKALYFYISILPAFVDLSEASVFDVLIMMVIVTIAVGGAKLAYAFTADKVKTLFKNPKAIKIINIVAGGVMIGAGIFLAMTT